MLKPEVKQVLLSNIKRLRKEGKTEEHVESYRRGFISTYDKGVKELDGIFAPLDYGLSQKEPKYQHDKEQRLIFQLFDKVDAALLKEEIFYLEVGRLSDFCELIEV